MHWRSIKDKSLVSPEMMYELDNQFHNMIVDYTSNHYIRRLMPSSQNASMSGNCRRYQITDTFETSTKQHLEILEAIAMKNLARGKTSSGRTPKMVISLTCLMHYYKDTRKIM